MDDLVQRVVPDVVGVNFPSIDTRDDNDAEVELGLGLRVRVRQRVSTKRDHLCCDKTGVHFGSSPSGAS